MISFIISLPPISKKNSQQIFYNQKTGKPFVVPSAQYKKYEEKAMWLIPKYKDMPPIDYPVNIKCLFFMPTKRRCDLTNLLEAIDDVMVKSGLLTDDNYSVIAGHDGSRVFVDAEKPRTEVYIEAIG